MTLHESTILGPRKHCPPFCDCKFPKSLHICSYAGPITDLIKCRCGEESTRGLSWQWHPSNTDALVDGPNITFHPTYSQGTAIVRGEKPLQPGMVHFWELRILTQLVGTDMMLGIGTEKASLDRYKFHFLSALGIDSQSWGYSYSGKIQHKGVKQLYGQKFSQGCILGVYVDLTLGYIEFYLNRRSLGVAYRHIPIDPAIKLYPMVCSTAVKTAVRLINATSIKDNLQLRAFHAISKQQHSLQSLQQMPGLRTLMQQYWFLALPVRYSSRSPENECSIEDEAVLPKSRLKRKQLVNDEDINDINDLYTNVHKIAAHHHSDSDDEYRVSESVEIDGLNMLL